MPTPPTSPADGVDGPTTAAAPATPSNQTIFNSDDERDAGSTPTIIDDETAHEILEETLIEHLKKRSVEEAAIGDAVGSHADDEPPKEKGTKILKPTPKYGRHASSSRLTLPTESLASLPVEPAPPLPSMPSVVSAPSMTPDLPAGSVVPPSMTPDLPGGGVVRPSMRPDLPSAMRIAPSARPERPVQPQNPKLIPQNDFEIPRLYLEDLRYL